MKNTKPIFNPATHYRIELQGQVHVDWLKSFVENSDIVAGEVSSECGITVIYVQADQSGIVGLLRKLHGLGITILNMQIGSE